MHNHELYSITYYKFHTLSSCCICKSFASRILRTFPSLTSFFSFSLKNIFDIFCFLALFPTFFLSPLFSLLSLYLLLSIPLLHLLLSPFLLLSILLSQDSLFYPPGACFSFLCPTLLFPIFLLSIPTHLLLSQTFLSSFPLFSPSYPSISFLSLSNPYLAITKLTTDDKSGFSVCNFFQRDQTKFFSSLQVYKTIIYLLKYIKKVDVNRNKVHLLHILINFLSKLGFL